MNDNRPNDIYDRLLKDRIIFLGMPIDEDAATHVIAKVLYLVDTDSSSPITLYVNSPGGSVPPSFGIIDAIDRSPAPVTTVCVGRAFGTAAMIIAHGSKGCRLAIPEAVFGLVPLRMSGRVPGARDEDPEIGYIEKLVADRLAEDTGQEISVVRRDMRAALTLDAKRALNYGLIDGIVNSSPRK
jgi:ATP-dependent Clp protease protease subunit